jgi:hypothetical protein
MYNVHHNNDTHSRFCVRVVILLPCVKHFHDHIISVCGNVWAYKISIVLPPFIKVPVPDMESKLSCISVFGVSMLPLLPFFYWLLEKFQQCGIVFLCSDCVLKLRLELFYFHKEYK